MVRYWPIRILRGWYSGPGPPVRRCAIGFSRSACVPDDSVESLLLAASASVRYWSRLEAACNEGLCLAEIARKARRCGSVTRKLRHWFKACISYSTRPATSNQATVGKKRVESTEIDITARLAERHTIPRFQQQHSLGCEDFCPDLRADMVGRGCLHGGWCVPPSEKWSMGC